MATVQTQEEPKPLNEQEETQPVFEQKEQKDQKDQNIAPEENNNTGATKNENTSIDDEPSSPQTKRYWKKTNLRKKKSKGDEQTSDSAQWPTPEEVRNLNASPSQKTDTTKPHSRNERNTSRSKKGISWKPLEVPTQLAGSPSSDSAQTANGQQTASSSSSNNNHYNGPSRSNKRRGGGHRGGRGPWSSQGQGQERANNPRGNQQASETHNNSQNNNGPAQQSTADSSSQAAEASGAPVVNNQTNSDPTSQNGGNQNQTGEPRGYRNRYNRGRGGQSFGRGQGYYGPKYGQRQNYPQQPPTEEQLKEMIVKQVEYYFSTDNLCKDLFLRQNMDRAEGWISIFMILNFRKVRELVGTDHNLLADSLKDSALVEISEDKKHIRRRSDWANWIYPPILGNERPAVPDSSVNSTPVQSSSETTVN